MAQLIKSHRSFVISFALSILFISIINNGVYAESFFDQKSIYEWGRLQNYYQMMPDITGDGHFNETNTFTFPFPGHRTTYSAAISQYDGPYTNPCSFNSRSVELKYRRIDEYFNRDTHKYMVMHQSGSKLVAITKTFQVFIYKIAEIPYVGAVLTPFSTVEIPELLLSEANVGINDKALIMSSLGEHLIHIVFPHAMYTLEIPVDSTEEKITVPIYKNPVFKTRGMITEVIYAKGHLFVAAGTEGIDVYKVTGSEKGKLDFVFTMDQKFFGVPNPIDIRDMALDLEARLYVADFSNGVNIIQIQEYEIAKSVVLHRLSQLANSDRIAVRGDHALVVTGYSPNEADDLEDYFIKEVFFDIEKSDYFVNRQFIDSAMKWEEIKMGDLFTFIQGSGHHRILYQGINKQLIPQQDMHSDYRQGIAIHEKDYYYVKQIQNVELGQTSFIGLSDNSIYAIQLEEIPPQLICQPLDDRQLGEHNMRIVMNSTDCQLATAHVSMDQNLWQTCQTSFNFKYTIHNIWVDGQNISVIGFVIAIVILSFLVLILSAFFLVQRYEKKFSQATKELIDYKQKYSALDDEVARKNPYRDHSAIVDKSGMCFNNEVQIEVNSFK